MITARFRRRLPREMWVARASRSFPEATLRLVSGIQQGDTAIELGENFSEEPAAVDEVAFSHPSIVSFERLERTERRSVTKYETTNTRLYSTFRAASVPPQFPVVVRDGWSEFDFTGTREGFERVRQQLDGSGLPYELVSIGGSLDETGLLTNRQREVLGAALREGYLSVPRECTLAELAETLDVDKSTASGVIRRGQARLANKFLVGPGADPHPRR